METSRQRSLLIRFTGAFLLLIVLVIVIGEIRQLKAGARHRAKLAGSIATAGVYQLDPDALVPGVYGQKGGVQEMSSKNPLHWTVPQLELFKDGQFRIHSFPQDWISTLNAGNDSIFNASGRWSIEMGDGAWLVTLSVELVDSQPYKHSLVLRGDTRRLLLSNPTVGFRKERDEVPASSNR